jgi:hypothetical protein
MIRGGPYTLQLHQERGHNVSYEHNSLDSRVCIEMGAEKRGTELNCHLNALAGPEGSKESDDIILHQWA